MIVSRPMPSSLYGFVTLTPILCSVQSARTNMYCKINYKNTD